MCANFFFADCIWLTKIVLEKVWKTALKKNKTFKIQMDFAYIVRNVVNKDEDSEEYA